MFRCFILFISCAFASGCVSPSVASHEVVTEEWSDRGRSSGSIGLSSPDRRVSRSGSVPSQESEPEQRDARQDEADPIVESEPSDWVPQSD